MGIDKRTPGYLVREELQREKLREKGFKKKLEKGRGSGTARMCWEKMVKKTRQKEGKLKLGGRREIF